MKKNSNLNTAKSVKNDEFYTRLPDIEKELGHYREHFIGKVVYCNCDDPNFSQFYTYFSNNFIRLKLKKVIFTNYNKDPEVCSYKTEIIENQKLNFDDEDLLVITKTKLNGDGDFRSDECVETLKEADIIVTNPPFSLFRQFTDLLVKHDKKFLVIGSQSAITYRNTFPQIMENKLWVGVTMPKTFLKPDNTTQSFGNICWFTNLDHKKRGDKLILTKKYNEKDYPKYDGFDAINVDKTKDIPFDYEGVMGVPITFIDKFNPEQFEILGAESFFDIEVRDGVFQKPSRKISGSDRETFKRIWIKNKIQK